MDEHTTTPEQNSSDSANLVKGVAVLGVVVVLIGGIYWYTKNAKTPEQKFLQSYQEVDNGVHLKGDYESAISGYEQLLVEVKELPDSEFKQIRQAQIKMKLAADLLSRLGAGDRERAVGLYRSVFEDTSAPASSRAIAINELTFVAHHYLGHPLLHGLFMDEPYKSMLEKDAGGDMNKAMILLYEESNKIFPNAHAYYQIALMRGTPLLNDTTLSKEEREEEARNIKVLIDKGDELLGQISYEPSYAAHIQLCRAMSMGIVDSIIGGIGLEQVENGYKKAISIADTAAAEGDVFARGTGIISRLTYSVFLVRRGDVFSGGSREDQIRELLFVYGNAEIMSQYNWIRNFLNVVWKRPDTDFMKIHVKKLADISPEFKGYLTSTTNWTF